jgi:hypothetical protein
MKKIIASALLAVGIVGSASAQGVVVFKNFGVGSNTGGGNLTPVPLVFDTDGTTRLAGTGFTAELLGGAAADSMVSLTPTVGFGTGNFAGTFAPSSSVPVPGVAAGAVAFLQVRVWNNQGGSITSYDNALIRNESVVFQVTLADALAPSLPILAGMNSFALTVVPEPSVVALALLGAGALFLRRRKG